MRFRLRERPGARAPRPERARATRGGGDFGNAHGINNQGTIAGHSDLPSGKSHATLYRCALGLNPTAYLGGRSTAVSSSVGPSEFSGRTTTLDRLTPHLDATRQ